MPGSGSREVIRSQVRGSVAGLDSGDHSAVEPPGPIPNPEVKRCRADGSGALGPARVGRCQVFARHLRKKVPGSFLYANRARAGETGALGDFG